MTKQNRPRSGRKVKVSKLLSEMYTYRDPVNVFYFGGYSDKDDIIKEARFKTNKNKRVLDKFMMPFYRNLFCRYTSDVSTAERWEIHGNCVIDYEKWKKNGGVETGCERTFDFKEEYFRDAYLIMPRPDGYTYDNRPLIKTSLYTNMYHAIPKEIRGNMGINDYSYQKLLDDYSYHKLLLEF